MSEFVETCTICSANAPNVASCCWQNKGALVIIRKNDTGEVRPYWDAWYSHEGGSFNWGQGNNSCDCCREFFWLRAGDDDEPEDIPCYGGEEAYDVLRVLDRYGHTIIDCDPRKLYE